MVIKMTQEKNHKVIYVPSGKFKYILNVEGGINVYGITEYPPVETGCEEVIFTFSKEDVEKAKEYTTNPSYPDLSTKDPPEHKLIYVALKNAFDEGILETPRLVHFLEEVPVRGQFYSLTSKRYMGR